MEWVLRESTLIITPEMKIIGVGCIGFFVGFIIAMIMVGWANR